MCLGATKPTHHNYRAHAPQLQSPRATTTEPTCHNYRAHTPQLQSPRATTTEPTRSGACAPQLEKRKPARHNQREARHCTKSPHATTKTQRSQKKKDSHRETQTVLTNSRRKSKRGRPSPELFSLRDFFFQGMQVAAGISQSPSLPPAQDPRADLRGDSGNRAGHSLDALKAGPRPTASPLLGCHP